MKDLYKRIRLYRCVDDPRAIERAIASIQGEDPGTARAARDILLNPTRKYVYDRTWNVAKTIGQLRANLGLLRAPNWLQSDCADFDSPRASAAKASAWRSQRSQAPPSQPPATVDYQWSRGQWATVIVACALLGMCIISGIINGAWNNRAGSQASRSTPPANVSRNTPASRSPTQPPAISGSSAPARSSTRSPLPPVETREQRLRKILAARLSRTGLVLETSSIDAAVLKVMQNAVDPLPLTGVMTRNFFGTGVAPLEIKTTSGKHYYIKVVDWTSKREILTAFIRGGEPFETEVPVGSYQIKYAAGESWFGPLLDFGEAAAYSRCDDRFDFTKTAEGYSGYTIELILQTRGNLDVDPISAEDF